MHIINLKNQKMNRLSTNFLIYNDENYRHAVNYKQALYNYPITFNYGAKHERKKYILHAGTQDVIELWQEGIYIYILAQNNGLSYLSLQVINIETCEEEGNVFLNESDCTEEGNYSAGVLDMDSHQQLNVLFQYLN